MGNSNANESGIFISYAQNLEDVMLWRALADIESGRYIDIGAAEPESDSVTHAFYLRGWRGVNIEPINGAFERLLTARPEDINLKVAVANQIGVMPFYLVNGGNGLSTLAPKQMLSLQQQGWEITQTEVYVKTLASIVEQHVQGPVHFLKIDVEGGERAVLESVDFSIFRPWIILVEATEPNSHAQTHGLWEEILINSKYIFVWFDGLNRFYVAEEKAHLADAFRVPPNVFDRFERVSEYEAKRNLQDTISKLADASARLQVAEEARHDCEASLEAVKIEANAEIEACKMKFEAELAKAHEAASDAIASNRCAASAELTAQRLEAEATLAAQQEAAEVLLSAERELTDTWIRNSSRLKIERDIWMQELYEVNRHSSQLMRERQRLIESNLSLEKKISKLEGEYMIVVEHKLNIELEFANHMSKNNENLQNHILTIKNLELIISNLNHRIQEILTSTSWKFSTPVRIVGRILGRR